MSSWARSKGAWGLRGDGAGRSCARPAMAREQSSIRGGGEKEKKRNRSCLRSDRDGLSGGEMLDKATRVALTSRATTARRRRVKRRGRGARGSCARRKEGAVWSDTGGGGGGFGLGAARGRPVAAPAARRRRTA